MSSEYNYDSFASGRPNGFKPPSSNNGNSNSNNPNNPQQQQQQQQQQRGRPVNFRNKPVNFRKPTAKQEEAEVGEVTNKKPAPKPMAMPSLIPMGEVSEPVGNLPEEDLAIEDFDLDEDEEEKERREAEIAAERRRKRKREIIDRSVSNSALDSTLDSTTKLPRSAVGIIESEKPSSDPQNAQSTNSLVSHPPTALPPPPVNNDEEFDMFSDSPSKISLTATTATATITITTSSSSKQTKLSKSDNLNLADNWDDVDGYYKMQINDVIYDRFQVLGYLGKGVFSSVLKCVDTKGEFGETAIKIIRANEIMRKAAIKEIRILKLLGKNDPQSRKHCVKLIKEGEHKGHTMMCFESLAMNLRETLNKFGKNVGINISAIKSYTRQLFTALSHLAKHKIVHADIKPDNILVSANFTVLKICDFGSAFFETDTDNDPTPYLVSRFYRPPEVMLGLDYDKGTDLWSIAVTLFELFTGRVMFPGSTNNDMLKRIMAMKGPPPNKQLRRHYLSFEKMGLDPHFDSEDNNAFREQYNDKVTGQVSLRNVVVKSGDVKSISSHLLSKKAGNDNRGEVLALADLLEKCLTLDEKKRPTINNIKMHEFLLVDKAEKVAPAPPTTTTITTT